MSLAWLRGTTGYCLRLSKTLAWMWAAGAEHASDKATAQEMGRRTMCSSHWPKKVIIWTDTAIYAWRKAGLQKNCLYQGSKNKEHGLPLGLCVPCPTSNISAGRMMLALHRPMHLCPSAPLGPGHARRLTARQLWGAAAGLLASPVNFLPPTFITVMERSFKECIYTRSHPHTIQTL